MRNEEARRLLNKYRKGLCTEEEKRCLEDWYQQWHEGDRIDLSSEDLSTAEQDMWKAIQNEKEHPFRGGLYYKIAIAALVLIVLSFSIHAYYSKRNMSVAHRLEANDVVPGQDKAVLTLSSGQRFVLDSLSDNAVIEENGLRIKRDETGQLICEVARDIGEGDKVSLGYNEISTPKGGQFKVVLPDGTKVWLNAASTLKYPTSFAANERRVLLNGEAYFEVAKKLKDQIKTKGQRLKAKEERVPFLVESSNQTIEVLGTHFNVNDYGNEAITKTTLVEGSVMVYANRNNQKILAPGQQSIMNNANRKIQVHQVDVEGFTAWKEGHFFFNDTDLKDVMRQLERWYDVEVVDLERFPNNKYNGKLSKSMNLSKVLQVLELTSDLKFEIKGERRLSLMK